ncbi:MAG: hypothetical protein CM15mP120_25310 [Pseudomonadota bacterium]|nr:MAG: hypothetical protein CM15mP120_25310 [Pseudomonadota bacterium]
MRSFRRRIAQFRYLGNALVDHIGPSALAFAEKNEAVFAVAQFLEVNVQYAPSTRSG